MAADLEAVAVDLGAVTEIVKQQRIGHKLLAAFYQQVVNSFEYIAQRCGYEFAGWGPRYTDFPNQEEKIADKYIWDYLPLYASIHDYTRIGQSGPARVGDSVLTFSLLCDKAFAAIDNGYIDPLDLESEESYIDIRIYRCTHNKISKACYDVYDKAGLPEDEGWQDDPEGNTLRIYYKRIELAQFLLHRENIAIQISNLLRRGEDYTPAFL